MADLPDKLYYSIREVAEHTQIEPHVLRYWESEFPTLKPRRSRAGSRTYRKRDIEEILLIRTLLHDEGYRIDGARKALKERRRAGKNSGPRDQLAIPFQDLERPAKVAELKKDVQEILDLIKGMEDPAATKRTKRTDRKKKARG